MSENQSLGLDSQGVHYVMAEKHISELEKLKVQSAKLQAQHDAIKALAREAEKKAEIAKHKSPQIKRSVNFLMAAKFDIEDIKEMLSTATESSPEEVYDCLGKLKDKVDGLGTKVDEECLANKIASSAQFGWRTVKFFESSSLFQGEDAEAMTKKLKSAEFQAAKAGFRGRGRGHFRTRQSRWEPYEKKFATPGFSAAATATSTASDRLCYGCGEPGHFVKFCPKSKSK